MRGLWDDEVEERSRRVMDRPPQSTEREWRELAEGLSMAARSTSLPSRICWRRWDETGGGLWISAFGGTMAIAADEGAGEMAQPGLEKVLAGSDGTRD